MIRTVVGADASNQLLMLSVKRALNIESHQHEFPSSSATNLESPKLTHEDDHLHNHAVEIVQHLSWFNIFYRNLLVTSKVTDFRGMIVLPHLLCK